MNFNLKEILTAFMVLFAVIDIVGNIPIIIDLRKKAGHIQSGKASIIALIIMIIFLFLGKSLLTLIGIDVNSFAVAGAFILFFIALEMILGITLYKDDGGGSGAITATVFPLAFPPLLFFWHMFVLKTIGRHPFNCFSHGTYSGNTDARPLNTRGGK